MRPRWSFWKSLNKNVFGKSLTATFIVLLWKNYHNREDFFTTKATKSTKKNS